MFFCSNFPVLNIDGLSIWTYTFIIIYLNTIKTFHLVNSKNILGKFYVTTSPGFWAMHLLALGFSSKNVMLKVSFLLHQMLFLISRINRLYTRDYYFYRCTLRSKAIFANWKPLKDDEKCFLFHLKSSFLQN